MTPVSPADVIANRLSLSLARSQQLTSSWLPPSADRRTGLEKDEEDARIFTAEPELLGLGFKDPASSDGNGVSEAKKRENDLRKRLLGKRPRQDSFAVAEGKHGSSKPRPKKVARQGPEQSESDDEDDGGRTTLGKPGVAAKSSNHGSDGPDDLTSQSIGHTETKTGRESVVESNGPKSFLDEVLTQNAQKDKNRKERKKNKQKKRSESLIVAG